MKPFDMQEIIKKRVDQEAEIEYADKPPELPKYQPTKPIKFWKKVVTLLKQLKA